MNQEETVWDTQTRVIRIEEKLDKLIAYVIPDKEDKSKCLASSRESTSKAQPSNHGKEGNLPRHRQNEKKEKLWCWYCGYDTGTKVDYIHKDCHYYGLCKNCYNQENPAVAFKKSNYKPIKQPKKKDDVIFQQQSNETGKEFADRVFAETKRNTS